MWPGFGDNMRVLKWIIERCEGSSDAVKTPIGLIPKGKDLELAGLELDDATVAALLAIDPKIWRTEIEAIEEYFGSFGDRLPDAINVQIERIKREISESQKAA